MVLGEDAEVLGEGAFLLVTVILQLMHRTALGLGVVARG